MQLWKSYPSFRKEATTNIWLYRVALNTFISSFRRENKKPDKAIISADAFELPDIPGFLEEQEKIGLLNHAIKQLTEIEKAVIMLCLDEKSYNEIGVILGITNSNVDVRLKRIKNKSSKLIKTNQPST